MILENAKHEVKSGGGPNIDLLIELVERYFTNEDLRDYKRYKTIVWMEGQGGKKFIEDRFLLEFILGYLSYIKKVDIELCKGVEEAKCRDALERFKQKLFTRETKELHPGCAKEMFASIIGEIEEIEAQNGKRIVRNACSKFADIEIFTLIRFAERLC